MTMGTRVLCESVPITPSTASVYVDVDGPKTSTEQKEQNERKEQNQQKEQNEDKKLNEKNDETYDVDNEQNDETYDVDNGQNGVDMSKIMMTLQPSTSIGGAFLAPM
eukprot:GHVN01089185.1.p1 GENE.GHVN01089185.1~~GHVN01089185.1.p1  ORF type:complete len:107 (-),score=25.38 GHVN01089185.1:17-337(-)